LAEDAFPSRDWLRCAFDILEKDGKGLLAFNDGKWKGLIASFGMVRIQWVESLYDGPVFFPGYKSRGADNELTVIARIQNMFAYDPECTLIEYDPGKDFVPIDNLEDNRLFRTRFLRGFDELVPIEKLKKIANEYNINIVNDHLSPGATDLNVGIPK
jgi:hypothetical protein